MKITAAQRDQWDREERKARDWEEAAPTVLAVMADLVDELAAYDISPVRRARMLLAEFQSLREEQ